jgi:hypothetical protein
MKTGARKTSTKKRVTQRRHPRAQTGKKGTREDEILCPDCREPMTQVVMHTTYIFKWECRCLPGIHFSE